MSTLRLSMTGAQGSSPLARESFRALAVSPLAAPFAAGSKVPVVDETHAKAGATGPSGRPIWRRRWPIDDALPDRLQVGCFGRLRFFWPGRRGTAARGSGTKAPKHAALSSVDVQRVHSRPNIASTMSDQAALARGHTLSPTRSSEVSEYTPRVRHSRQGCGTPPLVVSTLWPGCTYTESRLAFRVVLLEVATVSASLAPLRLSRMSITRPEEGPAALFPASLAEVSRATKGLTSKGLTASTAIRPAVAVTAVPLVQASSGSQSSLYRASLAVMQGTVARS